MSLAYRSDIDGLRAIAVGSVVLFHSHIPPFGGGFVGVDVFFVVTGFLITASLRQDMEAGAFSLVDFYDRRIRRILPALYVMLVGVSALAVFVLLPEQLLDYARSLLPAVLFYANVHFEETLKYVALSMEEAPLLHLWALAVAVQFAIVAPLALLGLLRAGGRKVAVGALILIAAASLFYSQAHVISAPKVAFYPLASRVWELLIGAVLALAPLPKVRASWASGIGALGLAAVLVPVFLYDKDMLFPGLAALPPVLGAALLIHAAPLAPTSYVTRLLSLPAMVQGGRISYALYLFHWPLLLLAAIYKGRHLTYIQSGLVIVLAVALAALWLRYVEAPMRRAPLRGGRRLARLGAGVLAILCVAGVARAIESVDGQIWPISPRGAAALAAADDKSPFQMDCNNSSEHWKPPLRDEAQCAIGPGAVHGTYDVLVWGDSHAGAAFQGIGELVADLGHTARLLTMPGCPPLIGGTARTGTTADDSCARFDAAVMDEIRRVRPKLVVLAGRWTIWTFHTRKGFDLTTTEIANGTAQSLQNRQRVFAHMVARTLEALDAMGTQVIILGQAPEYMFPPTRCVAQREYFGGDSAACLTQTKAEASRLIGFADSVLAQAAASRPNTVAFLQSELFCKEGICSAGTLQPGHERFFYLDGDHLTAKGAEVAHHDPAFRQVLAHALGARVAPDPAPAAGGGTQGAR